MVRGIRIAKTALGDGVKRPGAGESAIARLARKSLVAACDISAGTILGPEHLAAKRPGTGISPGMRVRLIGRKTKVSVPAGTLFDWEMLG